MASGQPGVLRDIRRLLQVGTAVGMTDAQLLGAFAGGCDESAELAFEAIVDRHGPMVLRVCRGVLRDEHAAEDAFQATFLVLARKARSLWIKDSLGSWLHGVAHRVASKARLDAVRRGRRERRVAEAAAREVNRDLSPVDQEAALSEEIARLPEIYRAPVVLCYLQAMSYETAAGLLGVTEAAVRGRLARARERLRSRLTDRGVDLCGAIVLARTATGPMRYLRPALTRATVQSAMGFSPGSPANVTALSKSAASLSERVWRNMMLTKFSLAAIVLALGVIAGSAIVAGQSDGGRNHPSEGAPVTRGLPRGVPALGGNLVIDWVPADERAATKEVTVDAVRHSVHLANVSVKRDARPNDGAILVDLQKGKTYKVTAAGEAFMSSHTGPDADPFPGVVVLYGVDAEDGYAIRQAVLAPGQSVSFRAPWNIDPTADVSLFAFFLDIWPESPNRGNYTLSITAEQTVTEHTIVAPFDRLIIERIEAAERDALKQLINPGSTKK
jgi:RNA polymerase sigma factor (sigma-70 family)